MKLHLQGWNDKVGAYNCEVILNEKKEDHEILFPNGTLAKQLTPFNSITEDWDMDGRPFARLGAWFDYQGEREFFTPWEMATLALEGYAEVRGITIRDRQPDLESRILAANRRAKAQKDIQLRAQEVQKSVPSQGR